MSVYFEIKQLAFIFCAAKVHDALTHVELIRWASYGDIMGTYRAWLGQLSPDIAAQIAHGQKYGAKLGGAHGSVPSGGPGHHRVVASRRAGSGGQAESAMD